MVNNESGLWRYWKKNTPTIKWTRIENTSSLGTPDLLGYNNSGTYFTVELKVTKGNKLRFSPHQIAYHINHPKNSFILATRLDACCLKLYEGSKIEELVACGLKLDACSLGLDACRLKLEQVGSKA